MRKAKTAEECDLCGAVWQYLAIYYDEHGFAPTYRQIADAVGLESKSSVSVHLRHLETAGLVKVTGHRGAIPTE